jgi:hypothetical protein
VDTRALRLAGNSCWTHLEGSTFACNTAGDTTRPMEDAVQGSGDLLGRSMVAAVAMMVEWKRVYVISKDAIAMTCIVCVRKWGQSARLFEVLGQSRY